MHQSRALVRPVKTKFSKKVDREPQGVDQFQGDEFDDDIDLKSIRSIKDVINLEEESNAGC